MKSQDKHTSVDPQTPEEGGSWQFKFIISVIALGVIGVILKTLGVF